MEYGLDNKQEFYVDYTSCTRPIGNMRDEMEIACTNLADDAQSRSTSVLISLSSGLDSQVLLHTFHSLGLPFSTAFCHWPGYNDNERSNIDILDKKYDNKTTIIEINPDDHKEEVEKLAISTGIPAEHHLMKMFLKQLPNELDILQGIESFDFIFRNKKTYCMESWTAIEIASQRALQEVNREGKIVSIDRRSKFNEFTLALLSDSIVEGYCNSIRYIAGNGLIEKKSGESPPLIFSWEYYVKPLLYGLYWKGELELFPKDVSANNIAWIMNPSDNRLRHNYKNKCAYVERNELINHLKDFGSNKTRRWHQYKG